MLIPLNDRVIIKRTQQEDKSAGGIVLPGGGEKPNTGVVIASANDALHQGDLVLYGNYAGSEIKLNNETVLIVKFEEIIAKVGV